MGDKDRLAGRVALITGGGGEIGSAIARRLAGAGAKIVVGDVVSAKATATAKTITDAGGEAIGVEADVTDPRSAEAAVKATIAKFGKLTTLVNVAAAITPNGTVETLPLEEWNKAFSVGLTGAFVMCKYGVPEMRKAGGGAIINIASQLGHLGAPERAAYCTTKAALIFFTRILAMDHAHDKIRANTISPGYILTDRSTRRFGSKDKAAVVMGPKHLLGRAGEVEDIASGALYLASEDASFVTGTDLLIDGGYVAFKGEVTSDGGFTIP
jgi:NAD(P)-dependent dehydrogenase (short-subunit alcohol dehydrogenase family)